MSQATTTFHGVNIRWGTNGVATTVMSASLMQSADSDFKLDEVTAKNQTGQDVAWVGYNPIKSATLEYVIADATTPATGSAQIGKPALGTIITVTDTIDSGSDLAGTNWIVKSESTKMVNTDVAKVTLKVDAYQSITS